MSDDPWDDFRERMRKDPFLGPFFEDIDREFARMQETFQRMLEDAQKAGTRARAGEPFVYGFSFKMGPDGRPVFQEFGDARPRLQLAPETEGAREPLVDVIVHDGAVSVTAELPGVDKKDVKVRAAKEGLTLRVDTPERRYFKRIELPVEVKPDTTKATYKNGVLDVEMERASPGPSDEGVEIEPE